MSTFLSDEWHSWHSWHSQDFSWRCLVDSTQWFFPGEIRNSACDWVTPNKNDLRNNNHTNSWVRQESGNLGVSKVIPSLVIFRIAASHGPLSSIEIRGIKAMAIWKFTGDRDVSWGCLRFRCHWEGVKLIIPMGAGVMSFCCLLYSCCVLDPLLVHFTNLLPLPALESQQNCWTHPVYLW